ncbi:MAG TPA: hypothetical protein VM452_01990 [Caulifigura sp.]|jgi:hypothetical protein|nr:hypothetical protein [Caulifigura sp.]
MFQLLIVASSTILGFVVGRLANWLVWMYVYGLGDSVISDDMHVRLMPFVVNGGAAAGAAIGAIVAIVATLVAAQRARRAF